MDKFKHLDVVLDDLITNVKNQVNFGIYGDYDVDGVMSLMIAKDALRVAGALNVKCFPYANRTHNIDYGFINFCLLNQIDYAIIIDTGSSNLELLQKMVKYGVKCLVLDHHSTQLNYKSFTEGINIINTYLDRVEYGIRNEMCGAAVAFVVFSSLLETMNLEYDIGYFACYALVAQYADCVSMNTEFGRFLYDTCETRESVPPVLDYFLGDKQVICRRFAEYWFSPKINAAFRREQFSLINALFVNDTGDPFTLVEEFIDIHLNTMKIVGEIVSDIKTNGLFEEHGELILCNLTPFLNMNLPNNFVSNHKGRIANSIGQEMSKACICVCADGNVIKGSTRDPLGRDLLKHFSYRFRADGHPPAFGFELNNLEWPGFVETMDKVGSSLGVNETVDNDVVDMRGRLDLFEIDRIAFRNEFSDVNSPPTFVYVSLNKIVESHKFEDWGYLLHKDDFNSVWINSNRRIMYPQDVVIYPYKSSRTKLNVVWW